MLIIHAFVYHWVVCIFVCLRNCVFVFAAISRDGAECHVARHFIVPCSTRGGHIPASRFGRGTGGRGGDCHRIDPPGNWLG
jgi:hypothetical protein